MVLDAFGFGINRVISPLPCGVRDDPLVRLAIRVKGQESNRNPERRRSCPELFPNAKVGK